MEHTGQCGEAVRQQYQELNALESSLEGKFFLDCPECGGRLHLGRGWRGLEIPPCSDCVTASDWEWRGGADPTTDETERRVLERQDTSAQEVLANE